MNKVVKNQVIKTTYYIMLFFVLLVVLLAVIFNYTLTLKINVPMPETSEGWYSEVNGQDRLLDELPVKINVDEGDSYTIFKTIASSEQPLNLLIYTNNQDIIVRLDDEIVYIATQEINSMSFYTPLHHIINIDHNSGVDQELSITYHSPYGRYSGLISPIYESVGSDSALYLRIIIQHTWFIGFGILFFLFGLVVFVVSHVVDKSKTQGRFYIAIFSILFGLYIIVKSTMLQFLTNNVYLLGGLDFTLYLVLPIPLLMYYKNHVTKRFERELLGLIGYYSVQSIVVTILQVIGVIDFVQPRLFVNIMLMAGMVAMLAIIVADIFNHNELAKKFSRYYGVLFLYSFITFINEQTFNHDNLEIYSLAVLALLAMIIFIDYIFSIETRLKISYLSESYAKLAYMDRLTGSKNRHAYEEDFERFFSSEHIKTNLRLVFFDFDGLKQINDQYGHIEGDFALKEGFSRIIDAFGTYGECYRIGGDEFACIIQSLDDDLYQNCRKRLINDVKSLGSYHKFNLRISMGTSIYEHGDSSPEDMIIRADMDMYQNKNSHKHRE